MMYRSFSSPEPDPLRRVQVGITAEIVLGSPRKQCNGIGICRIERANHRQAQKRKAGVKGCKRAKALLMGQTSGSIVFYFVKHSLSECCRVKQFRHGHFQLEEAVSLPWDIALELGCPVHSRLCAGTYRVVELGMHWAVTIKVERANLPLAVQN